MIQALAGGKTAFVYLSFKKVLPFQETGKWLVKMAYNLYLY